MRLGDEGVFRGHSVGSGQFSGKTDIGESRDILALLLDEKGDYVVNPILGLEEKETSDGFKFFQLDGRYIGLKEGQFFQASLSDL